MVSSCSGNCALVDNGGNLVVYNMHYEYYLLTYSLLVNNLSIAPGDPFHFDESLPVNNLGIAPAGDPVRPDDPPPVNNLDTATGDSVRPDDHDDKTGGMDGDPHVQLWNHTW